MQALAGLEVTQGARAAAGAFRSLRLLCHRLFSSSAAAKFPGFVLFSSIIRESKFCVFCWKAPVLKKRSIKMPMVQGLPVLSM